MAEDIEHWMADEPVEAYPETRAGSGWRGGRRRHRTWTRAAAGATLVVAVVSTCAAFFVDAARRSEQQQRLLTERLTSQRLERLRSLRQQGEHLLAEGRMAFETQDWQLARSHLEAAVSLAASEQELADLTARAERAR